ncbi:hypothetical protein RIR_jg6962.t1 [Rhizophagus irregularis DAOM 181602=DAOM 197198]|nr:hypothetical protein RIR_jg6962.t1 [Rhizophagus irregularis DAOM 181602=DAOM 197198]
MCMSEVEVVLAYEQNFLTTYGKLCKTFTIVRCQAVSALEAVIQNSLGSTVYLDIRQIHPGSAIRRLHHRI